MLSRLELSLKEQLGVAASLVYSTCRIYNIAAPLTAASRIELDTTEGLRPGAEVLVAQTMYGYGAVRTYQIPCAVQAVDGSAIVLDRDLPDYVMRNFVGLVVMTRGPQVEVGPTLGDRLFGRGGGYETDDFVSSFDVSRDGNRIEVTVTTRFKRDCRLFNLSLALGGEPKKLFLKNRKVRQVDGKIAHDVWLGKEGLTFGALTLLHNPEIASLEIVTRGRGPAWKTVAPQRSPAVVVNLEHWHAQRFRRTEIGDSIWWWTMQDRSAPEFAAGQEKSWRFTLFEGETVPPPRLLPAPRGYRATHVWTEHADKTTIETHRAAYYGHQDIERPEDAAGGFVRYGHPVTKSIFYGNPRGYQNTIRMAGEPRHIGPQLAYSDRDFRTMLDDLHGLGHEICLHAPAPDNAPMEEVHEAMAEIAGRYKCRTWIDHWIQGVHCMFGYDGADPQKPDHMVPLWRQHGIRYFWSWGSEDFAPKRPEELNLLHERTGDHTPTPLYWRSPGVPDDMLTWGANECPLNWFTEKALDALIESRGVSIHHHYYPYICDELNEYDWIEKDEKGRYRATERFNAVLRMMAERRDAGELYITTIGDIMDYWLALEKVRLELRPDGFTLVNHGDRVDGLAFAVQAVAVASEAPFKSRRLDEGDLLVWLDMPASGRVSFSVVEMSPASAK